MGNDFFSRRKTEIEDALLLRNVAVDMLDYLKVRCIDSEQYCAIRDYIESSAIILESDLRYTNERLQSKHSPSCGKKC